MSLKKASVGTLRSKTVTSYRFSSNRLSLRRFPFPSGPAVTAVVNYIEDVFSTYLFSGVTGGTQTITNGIDLSGKGGLVWNKLRSGTDNHFLVDSVRGTSKYLSSDLTTGEGTQTQFITAFNNNGFSFGTSGYTVGTAVSWTFRKQAKFFDVVTYTGNGSNRTIAHNLGSVPGCIIVKSTSNSEWWAVYHRSLGATKTLYLNSTNAQETNATNWNNTEPTSAVFTVGTNTPTNANGQTYVAYLFAHDAGGFGATGSDNVISCGSFTTAASGYSSISLGYEPQWVLLKCTSNVQNWNIVDNMRGFPVTGNSPALFPNLSNAEDASQLDAIRPTATGFDINADYFGGSRTFIYIAIRRGPMKTPTSGTQVFKPDYWFGTSTSIAGYLGAPADVNILGYTGGNVANARVRNRLTDGMRLTTSSTEAEADTGSNIFWANMLGFYQTSGTLSTSFINWTFRRAPGFFDVVCYTGNATANTDITHNLGVAPELIIVKRRNTADEWTVRAPSTTGELYLNRTNAQNSSFNYLGTSTSTTFRLLSSGTQVNGSGSTYVAYLFASLSGVSKVGSYTGTGTTLQVDCGFTAGARFVMIKRTDSTGDWYVWDSARGIVAGNDPYLLLNSTAAEVTNTDYIDPYSPGFEISSTAPAAINASGGTYIFLAIA